MRPAPGLARAPIGRLRETAPGRLPLVRLVREAVAVAVARGVALPEGEEEGIPRFLGT
jgi:hypothetical protein